MMPPTTLINLLRKLYSHWNYKWHHQETTLKTYWNAIHFWLLMKLHGSTHDSLASMSKKPSDYFTNHCLTALYTRVKPFYFYMDYPQSIFLELLHQVLCNGALEPMLMAMWTINLPLPVIPVVLYIWVNMLRYPEDYIRNWAPNV